jgi:hypothetical protein
VALAPGQVRFSFLELEQLWRDAGGAATWATTMAAIALAESGGCRFALAGPDDVRPVKTCTYRATNGENSAGLWQINVRAHPQFPVQSLFDALTNARAAVQVLGSGTPTPWSTYNNGAYLRFVPGTTTTPAGAGGGTPHTQFRSHPAGQVADEREANAIGAWHHLSRALGSTLPTQARRARLASHGFKRAIR